MLSGGRRIAGHGYDLAAPRLRPRQAFWITVSGLWALGMFFVTLVVAMEIRHAYLQPVGWFQIIRIGFWNPSHKFGVSRWVFATFITVSGSQCPFVQPLSQFLTLRVHFCDPYHSFGLSAFIFDTPNTVSSFGGLWKSKLKPKHNVFYKITTLLFLSIS